MHSFPKWLHNYNIVFPTFSFPSWCYCYLLCSCYDDSKHRIMLEVTYIWNTEAQECKLFWANNWGGGQPGAGIYSAKHYMYHIIRIKVVRFKYYFQAEPQNKLCFSSRLEPAVEKKINRAIFFVMSNCIYLWLWVYNKKLNRVNWSFPLQFCPYLL